jgi:hypothetical protein
VNREGADYKQHNQRIGEGLSLGSTIHPNMVQVVKEVISSIKVPKTEKRAMLRWLGTTVEPH